MHFLIRGYSFIFGYSAYGQIPEPSSYFIDSDRGNDSNNGRSADASWKSPDNLRRIDLQPGDSVLFKRGTRYHGPVHIDYSGTAEKYIVISDYGEPGDHAPKFTNKVFEQDNFGNCIRLRGDYILVENLFFHETSAYQPGEYDTDVFHITTRDAKNFIRNNIIVTRDSIVVFNTGQNRDNRPGNLIQNNLYFATDGRLNMGKEGPGENPVFGDPRFRNYSNRSSEGDYAIMKRSKGIDKALKLEASSSSEPCGAGSDIGAVEFSSKRKSKKVKNQ